MFSYSLYCWIVLIFLPVMQALQIASLAQRFLKHDNFCDIQTSSVKMQVSFIFTFPVFFLLVNNNLE